MICGLHWKVDGSSPGQGIPRLVCNPKNYYVILKTCHCDRIPNQVNPLPTLPHHYCKIHFSIILPSLLRSSTWSLPLKFAEKYFILTSHLSHACYTPRQTHPP